jgi:hypothetical protein
MTSFYGLAFSLLLFVGVDYVITPSHYERSFGYAQDDKVGWGVVWNDNKVKEYFRNNSPRFFGKASRMTRAALPMATG